MMGGKKDTTKVVETKTDEPKIDQPKKSGGGGFMNKVIGKIAKGAFAIGGGVSGMVGSTDDLNSVDFTAYYMHRLHPTEVQEIGQDFFNGWEPGGNGMLMMFTSKSAFKFTKINGSVKIDGMPANYATMGLYSSFTKNAGPRKIEVTTNSGQVSTFTVNPPTQTLKLLSINGEKSNATIDMSKDVVLEFADMPEDTKTPIMVQLTGSQIGIKTLFPVGWFAPKKRIVIPPAMFRNMGGAENNIGFANCYLQVSRGSNGKATNVTGIYPEVKTASIIFDGMFVNVLNKPKFNKGLEAKGKDVSAEYVVKKANAIMSPNFGSMKTLGVMGFAAKGSTSFYDSKTKYVFGGGYETTTKMATFPQFPIDVWDEVLNQLYGKITDVLATEFNVKIVDLEKVTNAPSYKVAKPYDTPEENTHNEFFITYKNTKSLSGFRPISEMASLNSPEYKVMKEVDANSLLKLTLNFQMNFEGSSAFMVPSLNFEILGPLVGDLYPTNYLSGNVVGNRFYLRKNDKVSPADLPTKVLNLEGLTAAFRKAMQDIKTQEKANGDYDIEWKAMNQ